MSKYLDSTVKELCDLLEDGYTIMNACKKVGIDKSTFYNWKSEYFDFADKVKKAEMEGARSREEYALGHLFLHMKKNWLPCAWWLERRHPDQYGKKEDTTASNENSKLAEALAQAGLMLSEHYKDVAEQSREQ